MVSAPPLTSTGEQVFGIVLLAVGSMRGDTQTADGFDALFRALSGLEASAVPFPWQRALFAECLAGRFPASCDIPTGLGKTSVIAIWLLALARHASDGTLSGFPRRLVYVVNRRTVVDQATDEVKRLRQALVTRPELAELASALRVLGADTSDNPIAISTLRGEFADNAEWRADPARPAVVIGTVDMIGSRLLFAGYGCGFKSRPLHAGFLGQDVLLVHDEAHLEPAFQELIVGIESEQRRCRDLRPLRVMALTATTRSGEPALSLTDADRRDASVRRRFEARKGIAFCPVDDEKKTADQVVRRALEYRDSGKAVLIFLRKLEDIQKVVDQLRKVVSKDAVQTLTGTLRGLERDALARQDAVFARFLPKPKPETAPKPGTVYLVCTSAGEVGIDMSADHLICDLVPFDSLAQRFGRVNRFGDGDARIDIVERPFPDVSPSERSDGTPTGADKRGTAESEPGEAEDQDSESPKTSKSKTSALFDRTCQRTGVLLRRLPVREDGRLDASPAALAGLPGQERREAFTPEPRILPVSDILFDAWALTSVRRSMPGRPPVTDWLHGIAEWEPPETHVAWREEVERLAPESLATSAPADLLDDYPLKPHELLRDRTDRVIEHLQKLALRHPSAPAWVLADDGSVEPQTLEVLAGVGSESKRENVALHRKLRDRTVLLPPSVGGLDAGMLDGSAVFDDDHAYDVADRWMGEDGRPRRSRVWDHEAAPPGMRQVRVIDTRPDADEQPEDEVADARRLWRWYVLPRSADDDGSRTATERQSLELHLGRTEHSAGEFVARLGLGAAEASAVQFAARWHDQGKHRRVWQLSIGNREYPEQVLAKSGGTMRPSDLGGYRHEFGSLLDVRGLPELRDLTADRRDLALHLIASHHGRARPHFPEDEAFDPTFSDTEAAEIADEVPRRFARLERRYGRWGLAYLESVVRAADALASLPEV